LESIEHGKVKIIGEKLEYRIIRGCENQQQCIFNINIPERENSTALIITTN